MSGNETSVFEPAAVASASAAATGAPSMPTARAGSAPAMYTAATAGSPGAFPSGAPGASSAAAFATATAAGSSDPFAQAGTDPQHQPQHHQAALRALRNLEATEARLQRAAERDAEQARGKLIQDLLPVLDNLDRTISAHAAPSAHGAPSASAASPHDHAHGGHAHGGHAHGGHAYGGHAYGGDAYGGHAHDSHAYGGHAAPLRGDAHPDQAMLQGVRMIRQQLEGVLRGYGAVRIDALDQPFDPNLHEAIGVVPVEEPERHGVVVSQAEAGYTFAGKLLRPAKVTVGKHAAPVATHRPQWRFERST